MNIKLTLIFLLIANICLLSYSESNENVGSIRIKRGLRSFFKGLFKKKTTTTTTTTPAPTTPKKPSSLKDTVPSNVKNDSFYKLKTYCAASYDQFCAKKKREIKAMIDRCDKIKKSAQPASCDEALSIFCYLYPTNYDCVIKKFKKYIPGKKNLVKTTTKSTPYKPYTLSPFNPSTFKIKPTTKKPNVSENKSPFGPGVVTTIPTDSAKLKEIGNYCLKINGKDKNCDRALKMLKTKFKGCDKASNSDKECAKFKITFCTAFSKFPCCPDVLAGRRCSGKSKRSFY